MSFYDHYFTEKNNVSYNYSSVQVDLPNDVASQVIQMSSNIADKYIHDPKDDTSMGREDDIHVTVLYGLLTNNPTVISHAVKDFGPFDMKFGQIKYFEAEGYDVLFIEVKSERLHQLNEELRKLDNKNTFKDYKPHCTIAYVKKSFTKDQYKKIDKDMFKDIKIRVTELIFCPQNAGKTMIPLLYRGGENRDDQVLEPKDGFTKKLDQPKDDPDITINGEYGKDNVKTSKGTKDQGGFEYGMID